MDDVSIITLCNDNYAVHLATMLLSLFENKAPETRYQIYIIDGDLSEDHKFKLQRLLKTFNSSLTFLNVDQRLFKYCKGWGHVSREAFYRISIPDLLDKKIKKALYLDSDLIIKDDLLELWNNKQLDHYFLGAVEDPVDIAGIQIPKQYKYFNSGVMLMNLDKWRKNNISKKVFQFIRKYSSKIMWWDQDALNAILYDKWFQLDYKWNYQVFRMGHLQIQPKIIHFNTDIKPWNGEPYLKEEYDYYRERLNW
ncbi:glycosyltransferase family 8 protein [Sporolactobacillus shoreae]|uniref:Glycosyltransferase family 8 protein n=1 Tax=Sporolactobacillus shoreae TaxID=1465501 RepID=A0A4Z0GQH2_9BACL|nr:glycosyltransferase family 8 protein [Sporolactobacillus shoreae]TGA98714.1 glycosyltransferase family 8 protein [Sporolactobacillus shoreae]